MTLFKNKYRIESTRLKKWDYSSDGNYFITICTKKRKHFFGEIIDNKMVLSETGKFAEKFWNEIPAHFAYASLDAFVVMPNHIHGILVINQSNRDAINRVSTIITQNNNANSKAGGVTKNHNPMLHNNLSRIIRWYKGRATFESRKSNPNFSWQSRFHDHIIRNDTSLYNIERYIKNNPKMWCRDKDNNIGLKM